MLADVQMIIEKRQYAGPVLKERKFVSLNALYVNLKNAIRPRRAIQREYQKVWTIDIRLHVMLYGIAGSLKIASKNPLFRSKALGRFM